MTATTLTTELEAVNTLLAAIGESDINTLNVTGLADVSAARSTLSEISREAQAVGWQFNTEDQFPLTRDTSGRIYAPSNAVKIIPQGAGVEVAQRGLKLYDKTNHRDTFESDLVGRVVFVLPWEELPQVARHYITIRAARVFQARYLGSDTQHRFSQEEEDGARKSLIETEGETGSYNIFTGSNSVTSIMER